jgi:hypothetical protein
MPRVQYTAPLRDEGRGKVGAFQKTANFGTPKRVTEVEAWLRSARKAIPEIPDFPNGVWRAVGDPQISTDFIRWELESVLGERAYIIIDRKYDIIANNGAKK